MLKRNPLFDGSEPKKPAVDDNEVLKQQIADNNKEFNTTASKVLKSNEDALNLANQIMAQNNQLLTANGRPAVGGSAVAPVQSQPVQQTVQQPQTQSVVQQPNTAVGSGNVSPVRTPIVTPQTANVNLGNAPVAPQRINVFSNPKAAPQFFSNEMDRMDFTERFKPEQYQSNEYKALMQSRAEGRDDMFNQKVGRDYGYAQYQREVADNNKLFDDYDASVSKINGYTDEQLLGMITPEGKAVYGKLKNAADKKAFVEDIRQTLLQNNQINQPYGERMTDMGREEWDKQNPITQRTDEETSKRAADIETEMDNRDKAIADYQNQQKEPKTWQELRDQMYGSEEDRRKKAQRRAMINGIGESLRHIGNLYFTGKGATPQQFNGNAAVDTLGSYEAGKKERDAMSYQMWQQKQKDEMAKAQNARENYKLMLEEAKTNADVNYKNTQVSKMLHDMEIDKLKLPNELNVLAGQAMTYLATGKIKEYEAVIAGLEAQNKPEELRLANKLKEATANHQNASAEAARASAKKSEAEAKYAGVEATAKAGYYHALGDKARSDARNNTRKADAYVYKTKHGGSKGGSKEKGTAYMLSDGSWVGIANSKNKDFTTRIAQFAKSYYSKEGKKYFEEYFGKGSDKTYTQKDWESFAFSMIGSDQKFDDFVRKYGGEAEIINDWDNNNF